MPRTVKEIREWLAFFRDEDFIGTEGDRVLRCFDNGRKTMDMGGFNLGKAPTKVCPVKPQYRSCHGCGAAEECRDYKD